MSRIDNVPARTDIVALGAKCDRACVEDTGEALVIIRIAEYNDGVNTGLYRGRQFLGSEVCYLCALTISESILTVISS